MKSILPVLSLLFVSAVLTAQPIGKSSYEQLIAGAEMALSNNDYYTALEKYEEAYDDREDRGLLVTIADLNLYLRDYARAARTYRRLVRRDKDNEYVPERYKMAQALKMNEDYEEAVEQFQMFIDLTDNDSLKQVAQMAMTGAEMAITMPANPQGVELNLMDKAINSAQSEYTPAPTADGNTLYYASLNSKEVVKFDDPSDPEKYVRIFRSTKNGEKWTKGEPLGPAINRPGFHSANVSLSPDGRRMYFNRITMEEGNVPVTAKIYMSVEGDDGWKSADEVAGVNGEFLALQPSVGELFGNEVLFFSSDMPGGYGGLDLYYATYKGDGVYGDPINLGPKLNTADDDVTPWWHDGTLYYSTRGLPGLGGHDIFYTVWDGSIWSEPANMGKTYNTGTDDISFRLDAEGYNGYLVSNRPEGRSVKSKTCCDDIYNFSIARMYADLVVGLFTDKREPLLEGTVDLVPILEEPESDPNSITAGRSNRFDFGLDLEQSYMVIASKEGYYPDTFAFNTQGLEESKTFQHRFYLKPKPKEPEFITVVTKEPIRLENILYDFDSDKIREEAERDLTTLKELMEQYPDLKIELRSHTDSRGDEAYNQNLSQRRAESARRWLIRNGIARARMEAKGYGKTVPQNVNDKLAKENTFLSVGDTLTEGFINGLLNEADRERAHELNRRTEFQIISGPDSIVIKTERLKKVDTEKGMDRGANIGKNNKQQGGDPEISTMSSLYGKKNLKGVPIMIFEERILDLGKVKHGEKRHFSYKFVNRGDTPLEISIISACDCTTTDYSTRPVPPGESGVIKVTFDSTEKEESETIDVDIYLENVDNDDIPIVEMLQYKYELIK